MKQKLWLFHSLCLGLFVMNACLPVYVETAQPDAATSAPHPDHWSPSPMDSFQIQFSDEIDLSIDADVVDLDAFETEPIIIEQLHQAGKKVICYINAGSEEDWRPDIGQFPVEVIGKDYDGWPGENWLDIRNLDALAPILKARLDLCQSKGFDGVDFDNLDAYQNDTGFDLTASDQLTYNRWLADAAHARGLAVGLKNDPEQIMDLEPWFDFVILESCFEQGWCDLSAPFGKAGKAIFDIEYGTISNYCDQAEASSISLIGKNLVLDEELNSCP